MRNGLIVNKYGSKLWFKNDFLHREDGPAIEWTSGTIHWYFEGLLHREDGAACEYANGDKEWWIKGKLHRVDGPACEYANGDKEWYYQDERIECSSQQEFERLINKIITVVKQPAIAVNDYVCPTCSNDRCSKSEVTCWRCGNIL